MKKNHTVRQFDMAKISKEIISIEFKNTDTIRDCMKKFYSVMRKNGVKKGTQTFNPDGTKGGITQNNFEWTICQKLFQDQLNNHINWQFVIGNTPKDLMAY